MKNKDTQRRLRRRPSSGENTGLVRACLFGVGGGCVCLLALLLIFSFICTFSDDPDRLFAPLGLLCAALSYACVGFIASKKHAPALVSSLLSGAVFGAATFIISLFLDKNLSAQFSLPISLLVRVLLLGASALGGVLATNLSARARRRRRR